MTNVENVRKIRDSLPRQYTWTERDLAVLSLAEQQAADLDRLSSMIDSEGLPAYREARNQRITLGRLLGLVDIPAEASTAAVHARTAAAARWSGAAER